MTFCDFELRSDTSRRSGSNEVSPDQSLDPLGGIGGWVVIGVNYISLASLHAFVALEANLEQIETLE